MLCGGLGLLPVLLQQGRCVRQQAAVRLAGPVVHLDRPLLWCLWRGGHTTGMWRSTPALGMDTTSH